MSFDQLPAPEAGSSAFLADRQLLADAADLVRSFGRQAPEIAASRAARSRDIGNHIHFCRWREAERLIQLLLSPRVTGTVH